MQSSGFQAAWCPSSWSCGWGTSSRAPARPPGTFFPSSELWVLHLSPQSSLPPPQVAPAEHRGEWWWVASCWCGGKWRWGDKSFWAKTWFTEVSLSQPHRMSSQNFFITLSQFLFPWFVFWMKVRKFFAYTRPSRHSDKSDFHGWFNSWSAVGFPKKKLESGFLRGLFVWFFYWLNLCFVCWDFCDCFKTYWLFIFLKGFVWASIIAVSSSD